MSAGIDSMTLIYAGVAPAKSGTVVDDDLRMRSKLLLYLLGKKNAPPVILPMIAVSELLVPVPAAQRGELLKRLTQRFVCPTFDLRAAALAADLFAQYLQGHHRYSDRVVLKADVMILASAKAAGATEFYSNDDDCRKLAVLAGMRGRELPTDNTMENKWYLGELRSGEAT